MASAILLRRHGFAAGVLSIAMAVAAVAVLVTFIRGAGAEAGSPRPGVQPVIVEVLTVSYLDEAGIEARFPGLVTARRESALGFQSGGRLADIAVNVGDRVAVGDTLASLDTRTLEAQLAAARADAAAAGAQAALARTTFIRQEQLVERGHVSAQRLDEAGASARAAEAQAEAARAAARALEVQLELARLDAPFDGVITRRLADEGAVLAPGAPLFHLVEDGVLEFRVGLPATDAARLERGGTYTLEAGRRSAEARLRALTGVVDRSSRSVEAVFEVPAGQGVSAGEVARLVVPGALAERGFWAPLTALAEGRRGLWTVYLLTNGAEGYSLEPRSVELLHTEGGEVYLRGAVDEGAMILSGGLQRVTPGQRVVPAGRSGA
ncbi:MAG: efflux RND transporter periplasmic adaptor subunit [Oceanicaulis sp.]|uniref:efflux RND transporter periplasmic adaptor subunit n=1 Tax=Glycocaulis sp. TaxID=1969725 RepID=UPI0025C61DA4|nr:efflux RND transporter periplasmic adaptor subunit [Glycocaulis sp.]MCC5980491.1 efflux RND transporter periplasmic adaptor subunit [Oceanicaulis sp.]MCH8522781.1 efflux RND transporter periplasmic adaptor subunit [Glycocaulis sp.]